MPNTWIGGKTSFVKALKLARILRLARAVKVMYAMSAAVDRTKSMYLAAMFEVSSLVVGVSAWCHVTACLWYHFGAAGWVLVRDLEGKSPFYSYLLALNWSMAQLQGSTDVVPGDTLAERVYGSCIVLGSVMVCAVFQSKLTSAIIEAATQRRVCDVRMAAAVSYMHQHQVPTALSVKVKQHIRASVAKRNTTDEKSVTALLPYALCRSLLFEVRKPVLLQCTFFHAWCNFHKRSFQHVVYEGFQLQEYVPGDILFCHAERCNRVYVAARGELLYCKYSIARAAMAHERSLRASTRNSTLGEIDTACSSSPFLPGDIACEPAIWCVRWHHWGDMIAERLAASLELPINEFHAILSHYPQVARWAAQHAVFFVKILNVGTPCDLFSSCTSIERHLSSADPGPRPSIASQISRGSSGLSSLSVSS